jgi:4-diphosphocytidyl-2-C-methyl-D-erythritol kinase
MKAQAPCKTNLFLEVRGKRPDGYHELDTIFAELDLADDLDLEVSKSLEVVCEGDPTVPSGPENLVWRAADALRKKVGRSELGAKISITKRVPSGGGLGGGSSDAAVALVALNKLWSLGLDENVLEEVAATIGSDCAFFIRGGLQRGTGRGEKLERLEPPAKPLHLVLYVPRASCPTPAVYKALAPHLGKPLRDPGALLAALRAGDADAVAHNLWNRLEGPCFELFPVVKEAKERLARSGLLGCLLSGSGATVFGIARDKLQATAVAHKLVAEGERAYAVCVGLATSRFVV